MCFVYYRSGFLSDIKRSERYFEDNMIFPFYHSFDKNLEKTFSNGIGWKLFLTPMDLCDEKT